MTWNADTPRTPTEIRFWSKVEKTESCWLWKGATARYGYFWSGERTPRGNPRTVKAHRWAYEHLRGPIPAGLTIDHLCKTTACVNPSHMEVVPAGENALRGDGPAALNARKTHCIRGHKLAGDNLVIEGAQRKCRTCRNDAQRRRYYARKAA